MSFLNTVKFEQAEGDLKNSYNLFMEQSGMVPKPMEMFSVSPELYKKRLETAMYYRSHPTLDFSLLTAIRYAVASAFNSSPCQRFNGSLLERQGMEKSELEKLSSDPSSAPMEEKDLALLIFVTEALKSPGTVKREDVEKLRDLGWTDRDIFDAVNHGSITFVSKVLMDIFQMES